MPMVQNSVVALVVLIVFLSTCNTEIATLKKECDFSPGDFKEILNATKIALEFLERNLNSLVADAGFGTLVLQSQIKLIQESHGNQLSPSIQFDLMMTHKKAQTISAKIVENLMSNPNITTESKENQLHWISDSTLWLTPSIISGWKSLEMPINQTEYKPLDFYHEVLNDELSDDCVKQLYNDCNISSECVHLFMGQLHSGYSLTHQVLFFIVARNEKCHLKWAKYQVPSENLMQFMDSMCRNVFLEASLIEHRNFPSKSRDIFSEQVAVCALAGYQNFLHPNWLRTILSWQSRTSISSSFGCFSKQDLKFSKDYNFISKRRRKRYDAFISTDQEDCSVHFTSVSLGALAMYLRYVFDSC